MKRLLTFLFFLSLSALYSTVQAQEACNLTLSGRVVSSTGENLAGASVLLLNPSKGIQANADGTFAFSGLCAGSYEVLIKMLGYTDQRAHVSLPQAAPVVIKLAGDDQVLQEVIVHEKLDHTSEAQTFQTLEGRALDETRGQSLGESLQAISGVSTIQTGPSIFKPVIHGLHSQRILILNNGIRQEGQQWGADHAPEIDPFIAANIVVIKDAGAIKYGTDALGGVVVVNPPDLPTTPGLGGELTAIGQSNGRSGTVSGYIQGGVKRLKGFGWRVQGTGKKSGDFHTPDYILSNTGFHELNFSAATGYHDAKYGVEVFFSHFQTDIGILRGSSTETFDDLAHALTREPPQYTTDFTYSLKNPRQAVKHDLLKLNVHRHAGANEFRLQYGFQSNGRKEFDIRPGDLNNIPSINLTLQTHTLDAEWEHTTSRAVRSIGVNGILQDNNNIAGTKRIPFIPNFDNLSAGVFVIQKLTFDKWTVDGGARFDYRHYDVSGFDFKNAPFKGTLNFHNVTLTLGGTYRINSASQFITSLGSTWRPPSVAELYSFGVHQSAAAVEYGLLLDEATTEVRNVKDVNFKNEQALKWVNTYRYAVDKLGFEVSGYYNYIFNYIYLKPGGIGNTFRGLTPYFRYRQTDASFLGLDVTTTYALLPVLSADVRASLLRVTNERSPSDYIVFTPPNRYELGLRYTLPQIGAWKNFYVESRVKYADKQRRAPGYQSAAQLQAYQDAGQPIPNFDFANAPGAYMILNVLAGVRVPLADASLDVRAGVTNALNTSYRDYTNRLRYYADDIGRNFTLAVKYSF